MRTALTNNARPRLGQTQLALYHGSHTITRRTVVPPLRHTSIACDAFTILPVPTFAAALVVNSTERDQRKCERTQKIAQPQREIGTLRQRGLQSWNTLHCRSARTGTLRQRRAYSTGTETSSNNSRRIEAERGGHERFPGPSLSMSDLHRYENLLATKLGLQLLLYISTGRSPSPKLSMEKLSDDLVELDSLESLLKRLEVVNKGLYELDQRMPSTNIDLNFVNTNSTLDSEISSLTWQCRTGRISTADLIYGYTQAVVHSRTGLSLPTYRNLVETFSTLDADVLTSIAMFPYFKTRQILSDRSIFSVIYQYGKVKDSRRLERFLWRLTQNDRGFRIANEWELVTVNGVQVPAPVNRRPRILDLLTRTALQGDQPHKAKAWATLLIQQGVSTGRMASVFNNFLTYCARQVNWVYGELWLQRAIAWAALFAQTSPWMLSKLVYRMLDLCMSCGKVQHYNNILDSAVAARLDVPPTDETRPDALAVQAQRVFEDWKHRLKQAGTTPSTESEIKQAAVVFQQEMAEINFAITDFIGVTDIRKLKSLMKHTSVAAGAILANENTAQPRSTLSTDSWSTIDQLGSPDHLLAVNIVERAPSQSQATTTYRPATDYTRMSDTNELSSILFDYDQGDKRDIRRSTGHNFRYWNQERDSAALSIESQKEMEEIKAENSYLAAQLEASFEKERDLTKSIEQLKSHISLASRKSLETVFLEKENFNIRFEMRELSTRYQTVLNEKEQIQKEVSIARADLKRLERRLATDMDALYSENTRLQEQLSQANVASEKRFQASRAREGNLQKILLMSEERVSSLRAEVARLQSADDQNLVDPESAETPSQEYKNSEDIDAKDTRRKFTLRLWKRPSNELAGRDNQQGTFPISSS